MAEFTEPEFERIEHEVRSFECCAQCEEPKFPHLQDAQGEKPNTFCKPLLGWPGCINPFCIAFGEQQSSAVFRSPTEVALNLRTRLNALRRFLILRGIEPEFRRRG